MPPDSYNLVLPISAVLLSLFSGACIVGVAVWWRKRFIEWIRTIEAFRTFTWLAEPALAVVAGLVVAFFEIHKKSTWLAPTGAVVVATPLWTVLVVGYVTIKVLSSKAKEKDSEQIKQLRDDLAGASAEKTELTRRLENVVRITGTVRELVNIKLSRVLDAFRDQQAFSVAHYLTALAPADQVQVIMNTIHQFFASQLEPGQRLRLGIYMRDKSDPNHLRPEYSFDGKKWTGVFSDHAKRMRIDEAGWSDSLMVQVFRSQKPLLVVPSCEAARRRGEFKFFHIDQERYLRSMVAFRHKWLREDGSEDALILTLDTAQDEFFARYTEEEISLFLVEMMKRVEFELLGIRIHSNLQPPRKGRKKGSNQP